MWFSGIELHSSSSIKHLCLLNYIIYPETSLFLMDNVIWNVNLQPGSMAKITITLPKVMRLVHSTPSCSSQQPITPAPRVSDIVYWTPVGNFMHVKKTYVHTHTYTYMLINTHINKNKYFTLNIWNENTFVSCSPFLLSFQSLLYLLALFQTHGNFSFACCLSVWASVCS